MIKKTTVFKGDIRMYKFWFFYTYQSDDTYTTYFKRKKEPLEISFEKKIL